MTNYLTNKWSYFLIAICAILVLALACEKDPTEPDVEGPDIPPISTFLMDFSTFPDTAATLAKPSSTLTYENWILARFTTLFWNVVILAHAAIPVAAYAESFQHTPEQQEDGSWVWSYSVDVGDSTYTAELHASTDADGINWEMYLSLVDGYTDFLWFTGQHNLLYTEGTWRLYKDPDDPVEFVDIEWHRSLANSTADIKYTNIEVGTDGYSGFIFYGITEETPYDAFYDIFNAAEDRNTDIEWNLETYAGHIRDETHYEDTLWHCWDETLNDVDCE
ncbi:MAG: hypothetical protein GY839_01745 [candidate division Zixibacteria bacterium]|nr:hypothetical protein [candidate division Zixibacteria bacterium]